MLTENYKFRLQQSGTAEGLMFHMPGRWQLILDVRGAAGREKLTAETVLE